MCRTTDFSELLLTDRNSLNVKAFFIRLSGLKSCKNMPDSLTLLYPPRINVAELFVDGSKVKSESPAFLTLHKVVNVKTKKGEAVFGSREHIRANGLVRFEVFLGDERVLKGLFSKNKEEEEWKLKCECVLESDAVVDGVPAGADVAVDIDGEMRVLSERVEMAVKRKKSTRRRGEFDRLEVIPEERDEGDDLDPATARELDGGDDLEEERGGDCDRMMDVDLELEGVQWAVDLGIWVMCLGVGYLISKASARSLRRLRLL